MIDDSFSRGHEALRTRDFAAAREAFQRAADGGNPSALFQLGWLASGGHGQPADASLAAAYYQRASDAGVAEAAYNLGALYALGRGVVRDPARALECYRRAAQLGDPDGNLKVGTMLALGEAGPEDLAEAERVLRASAEKQHGPSMLWLGIVLAKRGAKVEAARWYLDAARTREPDARRALEGLLPEVRAAMTAGDGAAAHVCGGYALSFENDPERAVEHLARGAELGHAGAQRLLGYLYERGIGAAADRERAFALYERAARGGDEVAQYNMGARCLRDGETERAVEYFRMASERGDVESMAMLGDALGKTGDHPGARGWYLRAAALKHAGAMRAAARYLRDGIGGEKNLVEAARWYFAAFDRGEGNALHDVLQLVRELTDDEVREAAVRAGNASLAESALLTMRR